MAHAGSAPGECVAAHFACGKLYRLRILPPDQGACSTKASIQPCVQRHGDIISHFQRRVLHSEYRLYIALVIHMIAFCTVSEDNDKQYH
eukprot:351697-Chlamydomonas_euryale.AAC.8